MEEQLTHAHTQKIELARALLAMPDVLLLHRCGDCWGAREQLRLGSLLRDFLSGALDELTSPGHQPGAAPRQACRCVVLNMNDHSLAMLLEADDSVLTIESPSRGAMGTKGRKRRKKIS